MSYYGNKQPSPVDELKKRVKDNKLQGVFLFWGAEEYTKDFYAEKIRKLVKNSPLPEFNYVIFDAETSTPGEFEEAADALPYLWEQKVIEIRNLMPGKLSADDGEAYARILATLPEYLTVLVMLRGGDYSGGKPAADAKKPEKEKRNGFKIFLSAVEEYGLSVEFQTEKGDKLCHWVERHFASRNVRISRSLPSFMVSYCGSDMYTLQGEINKLCDAYDGTPLTEQDVKRYCCANESHVFFDVASCMIRQDLAGARRILSSLRMTQDDVTMAMGYLASNYRLMALVKAGMDQGKSANQIATEQKITSWKVNKVVSSLQNIDSASLHRAITDIAEADIRIKTRRGDSVSVLELLVYRICMYGR